VKATSKTSARTQPALPATKRSEQANKQTARPAAAAETPAERPVVRMPEQAAQKMSLPKSAAISVPRAKPVVSAPARADVPPEAGFTVVVDGHFKAQHATEAAARAEGQTLKSRFPFLRIEIFDAVKKVRSSVG
jgi:hypothetical protein